MNQKMDWNDPAQRLALIERVGPQEYNRMIRKHLDESVVSVVNGHQIRSVQTTRYGLLYEVVGSGKAFVKYTEAEKLASELPEGTSLH